MKIKLLRINNGWTQAELAKKLGLSLDFIRSLESGRRLPSIKTARKIADVFGCETIDEVLQTYAS